MNFCCQGLALYIVECEPLLVIFEYITGFMRVLICQLSNFAIPDCGIIEREICIMLFMCLTVLIAESASVWSTMFQEVLSGILLESLTTMFRSYTLV